MALLDVEAFLSETEKSPACGPNLEHDPAFFELEQAARGRPEQAVGRQGEGGGYAVKAAGVSRCWGWLAKRRRPAAVIRLPRICELRGPSDLPRQSRPR
jgi:hypothetical protein